MLERIMYSRLYKYLVDNDMLYHKHFGFQKGHSTDHAVMDLANDISDAFNKGLFTLGVFIDLSKAFYTIHHTILFSKLEYYGIKDINLH